MPAAQLGKTISFSVKKGDIIFVTSGGIGFIDYNGNRYPIDGGLENTAIDQDGTASITLISGACNYSVVNFNQSQTTPPTLPVTSTTDLAGDTYNAGGKTGYLSKKVYTQRQNNIAAYKASPAVVAPLWTSSTAVIVGKTFRLTNGQHITYSVAGTTGLTEPTGYFLGRAITDGTATAYASRWVKTASDTDAPIVTYAANFAATGLSQELSVLSNATQQDADYTITEDGIFFNANVNGRLFPFAGAIAPTPNATATLYNGINASAKIPYLPTTITENLAASSIEYDIEICDSKFSLGVNGNAMNLTFKIDGQLVQGDLFRNAFGSGNHVVFDFAGVTKWRKVSLIRGFGGAELVKIGLTQQGRARKPERIGDVGLLIADSYGDTFSPDANQYFRGLGSELKQALGLSGLIVLAAGGCGYVNTNGGNGYNALGILNSPVNKALFANSPTHQNIKHVIFHMGGNDKNNDRVVAANAALAAWRRAREIFPNAKITAVDSFSAATGPDANNLDWSAKLQQKELELNDPNFRLVNIVGTDAARSIIYGSGRDGVALGAGTGNASFCISTDNTHLSPHGVNVTVDFIAEDIQRQYAQEY